MKKATSFTLDERLIQQAEEIGKALGKSKSWVMENAIKSGLPYVVKNEQQRMWQETRNLSQILAESLSLEPGKYVPQSQDAAASDDGGAPKVVDPRTSATTPAKTQTESRKSIG